MKFIKNNKKIIAAFAAGGIIFSGIGYAANTYMASDIQYTKSGATDSITVSQALNELYNMKKNYILPSGTIPITTKGNQIDVKNYEYADTTGLYTKTELDTAVANAVNGKYDELNVSKSNISNYVYTCGFVPKFVYIRIVHKDYSKTSTMWSDNGHDFWYRQDGNPEEEGNKVDVSANFLVLPTGLKFINWDIGTDYNIKIWTMK